MTSLSIRIRRCRAQASIDTYAGLRGSHASQDETLIDLLTDLLHWCDGTGLDFENSLDHAQFHHDAEKGGAS